LKLNDTFEVEVQGQLKRSRLNLHLTAPADDDLSPPFAAAPPKQQYNHEGSNPISLHIPPLHIVIIGVCHSIVTAVICRQQCIKTVHQRRHTHYLCHPVVIGTLCTRPGNLPAHGMGVRRIVHESNATIGRCGVAVGL
jgi:hypothetical protein